MAGAPPFAEAAHDTCIRCHIALASPERPLPLTCDSCHNAAKKAGYATISPLPRLDAGQPDIVRMGGGSSPENEALPLAPKPLPDGSPAETGRSRASATPVTFDHKRHEAATESCRSCHHNTLQQCSSCHTPAGGAKGGNIPLATAMHKADSPLSCVGCHETRKTAQKECAGCHALTPVKKSSQVNCASCHTPLPKAPGLPPESSPGAGLPGGNASAPDTLQAAAPPAGTREREALARAPATISIGALANEYEPSVFPHKRVVESLISGMENAAPGMMRFHAEPYALCASCHHNSPPSAAPPPCATCHSMTGNAAATSSPNPIPSLRTAYHRQCMSCHTAMTIKPAATDCAGCHAKRGPLPNGGR